MREFKCVSCGYSIQIPFCNGRSGRSLTCPQCGNAMRRAAAGATGRGNQSGAGGQFTGHGRKCRGGHGGKGKGRCRQSA